MCSSLICLELVGIFNGNDDSSFGLFDLMITKVKMIYRQWWESFHRQVNAEVPRVAYTKVIQCLIFGITTVITIVINNSIIFVTITAIIIIFIAINISEDFCTYFQMDRPLIPGMARASSLPSSLLSR